jgi:two-component system LytT family response regulator
MSKPVSVRVLLLEGDPALREHLERLLRTLGDVSVRWSGGDPHAAAAVLRGDAIDLLFLGAASLSLFASDSDLLTGEVPAVVVVAPDTCAAVQAFAIRAVDYVLSPPSRQRVAEAVERGRASMGARMIPAPPESPHPAREIPPMHRLLVKSRGHLSFVRAEDISWVEAQGDYVCIHAGEQKHLIRERISRLVRMLPSRLFLRIHRSAIVNIERVREMRHLTRGEYAIILLDGTRLTLSRSYRTPVLRRLTAAA